jgi:TrmH family RNA methyltransferase
MLSKTQSKYIRSLALQKFRKVNQCYLAEGDKIALEWLNSSRKIEIIAGLEYWIKEHHQLIKQHPEASIIVVSDIELKEISSLQSPNKVLLVVKHNEHPIEKDINEWCIALDDIQDPGNMGTILRIADWFGINHIICSMDCVDPFSPKVVQAAMGAHLRVKIYETSLQNFIKESTLPLIAAVLGGDSVFQTNPIEKGIILIGNEGKGINADLINLATLKITIPRYGKAESLNAGVSAGIICALLLKK